MIMRWPVRSLKGLLLTAASCFALGAQGTVPESDEVLGNWLTEEGKAVVEIFRCEEKYCGRIAWLRDPLKDGNPVIDDKNPDEKLKDRPVLGMVFLQGFVYDEDHVWTDGTIYDPESGDEYSAKVTLVGDTTLELRGYVLIPLFGRTEEWTRVNDIPDVELQPAPAEPTTQK